MPSYELHSHAAEVSRIQPALRPLGLSHGPVDGDFGGGTLAAVKAFQRSEGLQVDGVVGPDTWAALLPGSAIPSPAILEQPLPYRCLALTGSFETDTGPPDCFAGLAGDFRSPGHELRGAPMELGTGDAAAIAHGDDPDLPPRSTADLQRALPRAPIKA